MAEVRAATEADIPAVAEVLVRAFHDDPIMNHLFRKDTPKKAGRFFTSDAKRALAKGEVHTTGGGSPLGGAIWFGPGHWKLGGLELLKEAPMLLRLGSDIPRSLSFLSAVEKVHPKEPHWYLAVLGTDPDHQGKGIGGALLSPVLQKCDEEGLPAYLESSKERNIPFYNRYGFEVTGEVKVKDSPTAWQMWREPRPPESG